MMLRSTRTRRRRPAGVEDEAGSRAHLGVGAPCDIFDDDLTLRARRMPQVAFGYFIVSPNQTFVPTPRRQPGRFCEAQRRTRGGGVFAQHRRGGHGRRSGGVHDADAESRPL